MPFWSVPYLPHEFWLSMWIRNRAASSMGRNIRNLDKGVSQSTPGWLEKARTGRVEAPVAALPGSSEVFAALSCFKCIFSLEARNALARPSPHKAPPTTWERDETVSEVCSSENLKPFYARCTQRQYREATTQHASTCIIWSRMILYDIIIYYMEKKAVGCAHLGSLARLNTVEGSPNLPKYPA